MEVANLHFGGCRFTFWRVPLSCMCFIEKRGPPKGGCFGFLRIDDLTTTNNRELTTFLESRNDLDATTVKRQVRSSTIAA